MSSTRVNQGQIQDSSLGRGAPTGNVNRCQNANQNAKLIEVQRCETKYAFRRHHVECDFSKY